MLTDSGSCSNSLRVASFGHYEHFRFRSRAFSAHPAGLRSTHCVILRSLLVGVSFRSCWHRFPSIRSFCVGYFSTHYFFLRSLLVGVFLVVSRNTLSCTHTLSLTAFGNTHIDTNRNLAQTLFPFMHSSSLSSFLALAHIHCRFHFSPTRTYFRRLSIDFFQTSSPSFSYSQTDHHYLHVVPPCILLGLLLQRGFAVVVAKRCCRF